MVVSQSSSSASRAGVVAGVFVLEDDSPKDIGRSETIFLVVRAEDVVEEVKAERADPTEEEENLDRLTDSVMMETSCHC